MLTTLPYHTTMKGGMGGLRKATSPSSSTGILRLANRPGLVLSSNRLPAAVVVSEILSTSQGGGRVYYPKNTNSPREFSNASTTSSVMSCTSTVITPRVFHCSNDDKTSNLQKQLEKDAAEPEEGSFWSDFANNKF